MFVSRAVYIRARSFNLSQMRFLLTLSYTRTLIFIESTVEKLISVIVDSLKLYPLLCLFKFMHLDKETFSVSPLNAKGFVACVAWRFKQFGVA